QQLPAVPDASVAPVAAPAQAAGPPAFVGPPVDPNLVDAKKKTPVQEALGKVIEKLKPEKSEDVLAKSGGKKGQTIPTRTWIMLGVTLVAAVGLLLWEEEPAEVAAPQQQVQAQGGAVALGPSTAQPTAVQPTPATPPTPPIPPTPATDPAVVADPPPPSRRPARRRRQARRRRRGRRARAAAAMRRRCSRWRGRPQTTTSTGATPTRSCSIVSSRCRARRTLRTRPW